MNKTIISIENLSKSFKVGNQNIAILKEISFEVKVKDFLVIFGPSGCGKSTLLHSILGLEEPTSGKVLFLGENLYDGRPEDERSDFRKKHIGMVYQQANWIKSLSVVENVAFPLLLLGIVRDQAFVQAEQMLKIVGMIDWANYVPTELSSGQQQRVALARALISNPEVIIADEPTGNLDFESGQRLMELVAKLNQDGKTIIMVTHDLDYLRFAKTAIKILDGKILTRYGEKDKIKLTKGITSKRTINGNNQVVN